MLKVYLITLVSLLFLYFLIDLKYLPICLNYCCAPHGYPNMYHIQLLTFSPLLAPYGTKQYNLHVEYILGLLSTLLCASICSVPKNGHVHTSFASWVTSLCELICECYMYIITEKLTCYNRAIV